VSIFIEPENNWENGYGESFNRKHRDEVLNREIFDMLLEVRVLLDRWRYSYIGIFFVSKY